MKTVELTCIRCPLGCSLVAEVDEEKGVVVSVTGNGCPNGDKYARIEVVNPTRIVTSSVPVDGGDMAMVSVKTASDVPKGSMFEIMKAIRDVHVKAPVHIGDVIVHDVAGLGVDIIATRNVYGK